jgi:undecaprenyl-diphosphatase
VAIGFGQCLSLLPGVSRSGSTILTGLLVGLDRRAATDFSFLLAHPTMYAATIYTLWKSRADLAGEMGLGMAIGLLTAYVSALVVINAFLRFVQTNSLRPFGWYRIAIGLAVLAWLATR